MRRRCLIFVALFHGCFCAHVRTKAAKVRTSGLSSDSGGPWRSCAAPADRAGARRRCGCPSAARARARCRCPARSRPWRSWHSRPPSESGYRGARARRRARAARHGSCCRQGLRPALCRRPRSERRPAPRADAPPAARPAGDRCTRARSRPAVRSAATRSPCPPCRCAHRRRPRHTPRRTGESVLPGAAPEIP